jgi:hypothetical protein
MVTWDNECDIFESRAWSAPFGAAQLAFRLDFQAELASGDTDKLQVGESQRSFLVG